MGKERKSWRPDGWENPIPIIEPVPDTYPTGSAYHNHSVFESGADAMLRALITQDSKRGANVLYVDELADASTILHKPHRKGWLVFIPDESEDKGG